MEVHIFSAPEFTLEVPAECPLPVESNVLLQLQTELYKLLTLQTRHKLQATLSFGYSGTAVPSPPKELLFVELDPEPQPGIPGDGINGSDAKDVADGGITRLILRITDSRVASELFVIGLRSPFITLPHGMRLYNRYGTGGGAAKARSNPAEILRKKEALRSRMNLDEDLWDLLRVVQTPEWLQALGEAYEQQEVKDGAPMRESQRHEQRVEILLHYCEKNVHYIGVMNEEGSASPFLLALGTFFSLGLTHRDALTHFARHHRRTIRALALFIARYTLPPEEWEAFFAPPLMDEVVVSCAEDHHVTCSMQQLCEDLLLRDEVCEAWPPTLHVFWIDRTVRPMMQRVESEHRRREELRKARETGGDGGVEKEAEGKAAGSAGAGPSGSGKGVGVFGFRHIVELDAHVRERQRVLVPQRILSMLGKGDLDEDGVDGDSEDDDDFSIKVKVASSRDDPHHAPFCGSEGTQQQQQQRQPQKPKEVSRKRKRSAVGNTQSFVITGAYRTILNLLGRTEPFDPRSEHYLEF
uniref:Pre-mRNA-splicing factor 38 n=1 Tax=Trypanosoma congolense (strain IL3000) TaxID=1068625 RepID=G0UJS9_TRYCI|nr:conserved hypothetical protein [Trypanosoma congolense IL3000]